MEDGGKKRERSRCVSVEERKWLYWKDESDYNYKWEGNTQYIQGAKVHGKYANKTIW